MQKHELLVPAGDMESLYQAIMNGADAVYLGCKSFGARKFAKNFDKDEIIEAVKLAHLYGVKIYVTMNTLVKDNEVESFLNQIEFLHKIGTDAVLIQDFGMINLVREMYPNLEVHASTQANTSSKETAELFYNLGVKRVVFSREMTLEEINEIDVPIEKEVFIHGALCISYSGCCLMSSMLGNRSGNRGECTGCCRLPYNLESKDKVITKEAYLLSTKELNTSPSFSELLKSNITSFKIEGRMKSPEYVGFITSYYRKLIDGKPFDLEEETNKLKTIFNREFTVGNLFKTPATSIINSKTPNHIGLEIGKVIEVTPRKIKIKLTRELNQQDGIRFLNSNKGMIVNFLYDEHNKLVNSAENICYVDNKIKLERNDIVCKTLDYKLMEKLKELPKKKIPISVKFEAYLDKKIKLTISDFKNTIEIFGNTVQQSITSPLSKLRIKEQLQKLGSTPFECKKIEILSDDNIFISIKELNDLRKSFTEKLIALRTQNEIEFIKRKVTFTPTAFTEEKGITASIYTEEQLNICLSLNLKRVYVSDLSLYEKYKNHENVFYKLPRCQRSYDNIHGLRTLQSDYFKNSSPFIANYSLNATNIYTIYYLQSLGATAVTLSVELKEEEMASLIKKYEEKFSETPNVEVLVYGRVENMLIKGNILSLPENAYTLSLHDIKDRIFPTYFDGVNTHILNYESKNIASPLKASTLRLDFYDEDATEITKLVNQYRQKNYSEKL